MFRKTIDVAAMVQLSTLADKPDKLSRINRKSLQS
jgi:hypothetical protein